MEHTITEERYGVDLVEEQIKIAANHPLRLEARPSGHSIQCRINAERVTATDNEISFRPTPGRVTRLKWPEIPGVRVDTHLKEGDKISPHYDSMVAKVVVHSSTREDAIDLMIEALEMTTIEGVPTTIPFHIAILKDDDFRSGAYTTAFVELKTEILAKQLEQS